MNKKKLLFDEGTLVCIPPSNIKSVDSVIAYAKEKNIHYTDIVACHYNGRSIYYHNNDNKCLDKLKCCKYSAEINRKLNRACIDSDKLIKLYSREYGQPHKEFLIIDLQSDEIKVCFSISKETPYCSQFDAFMPFGLVTAIFNVNGFHNVQIMHPTTEAVCYLAKVMYEFNCKFEDIYRKIKYIV